MGSVCRVSDDSIASAAVFCASTPVSSSLLCRFLSSPDGQQEDRSPRKYQAARRGCLQCRRRAQAQTSHAEIDRGAHRRAPARAAQVASIRCTDRASDDPRVAGNQRSRNFRSRSNALRARSRYNKDRESACPNFTNTSWTTLVARRRTYVFILDLIPSVA